MSHCSCQPPAALTCGGWIPAGSRPSEVTLAQQHIPWFMEHGAPSSWFKPLLGPRSPFPGHGAALCFPLATSNTSQEALSPGHPACTSSCPSSSIFSSSLSNPKLPFWEECYPFWGECYPCSARKLPDQWLLHWEKLVVGFGKHVQLPSTQTSPPEKPDEL